MWWTIARKELQEQLYNPRFIFIFVAAFLVVSLALFNGFDTYVEEKERAQTIESSNIKYMESNSTDRYFRLELLRHPSKLSILDIGLSNALGISQSVNIRLEEEAPNGGLPTTEKLSLGNSRYATNPGLALFKELDITQTVLFLFSLFALLMSHNVISGEREDGTLKLIHSNSISRAAVLSGKAIGGMIPLWLALVFPMLFGLTWITLTSDIQFAASEWGIIALMMVVYLIYISFFYLVGLVASAFNRTAFMSFMVSLLIWVVFVIIVPRAAVELANQSHPITPGSIRSEMKVRLRDQCTAKANRDARAEIIKMQLTEAEYQVQRRTFSRRAYTIGMEDFKIEYKKLVNEWERQADSNLNLIRRYSFASPAALLRFTTSRLSNNDYGVIKRMEEIATPHIVNVQEAAREATKGLAKAQAKYRQLGPRWEYLKGTDYCVDYKSIGDSSMEKPSVDYSNLPRIQEMPVNATKAIEDTLFDLAALTIATILLFAVGLIGYQRYDVR